MSLTTPQADLSDWLEGQLTQRTRTFEDEYGTFYAYLEGATGGETVLLWTAKAHAAEVLAALPKDSKGRLVLGLDASPGYSPPFARALYWASPRYALLIEPGEGIGSSFAGGKETAEGIWAAWDDPRQARRLEVEVRPHFSYHETRAYAPWEAPPLAQTRSKPAANSGLAALGALGWAAGIPTYALGLIGLKGSLQAMLGAWKLSSQE
ncbi:MAG: hypothetical protein IVW51_12925 [Thermaceae bacterium]|nr:hypothetical protein [Thermaceae bacterium]